MPSDRPTKIIPASPKKRPPRSANFRGPGSRRVTSLIGQSVPRGSVAALVSELLDSPEIADLIFELDALRWTGRKGYGTRALVGACLIQSLYAIPTWSRTAAL